MVGQATQARPILSLVIPCYNEGENLPRLVERCAEAIQRDDVEVIFVDNGSSDNSPQILAEILPRYTFARSVRVEVNRGYGFGILSGLQAARGQQLAWTHADMQADPGDAITGLDLMLAEAPSGAVFIKGRRYGRPLRDKVFAWAMAGFEFLVLGQAMWDINAQPTMFSREFFESWSNPPHDFALDLFAYHQAITKGIPIVRFPVYFGARTLGYGHNETLRAKLRLSLRTIRFSLDLRRRLRDSATPLQ